MVRIDNGILSAEIDEHGSQLRSLKKNGRELLWQGDDKFWEDTSPLLFPICSRLKDNKYIYSGKEYFLEPHGFAQHLDFTAQKLSENSVCMTLKSDEKTLNVYPFEFVLKAVFTLEKDSLITEYIIENPSDSDMYYSIGAHEGYNCDGGFENYDVIFNKTESFETCVLDGDVLGHSTEKILPDGKKIELKSEYFIIDALIFDRIKSDEISLVNRNTGDTITVTVGDFENLLIWTVPGASFVCLEPWCGFPDYIDTDHDFTKKKSIIKLSPHSTDRKCHIIKV